MALAWSWNAEKFHPLDCFTPPDWSSVTPAISSLPPQQDCPTNPAKTHTHTHTNILMPSTATGHPDKLWACYWLIWGNKLAKMLLTVLRPPNSHGVFVYPLAYTHAAAVCQEDWALSSDGTSAGSGAWALCEPSGSGLRTFKGTDRFTSVLQSINSR